jgi:1,4-dihydroxy-2-naphthoate polyprenyltransferase
LAVSQSVRSPLRLWFVAARPRTLPAAVAPVLVGTALAGTEGVFKPLRFVCALIGSIFIQVGTNLANDYSDAKRGADSVDRLGPVRVTASGLVAPQRVLVATWVAFGIAVACGIYLTTVAGPLILVVGVLSIAAGVLYTGGPRPYGYEGLGELFVFLFFGLVAVNGSYYVQLERLDGLPFGLSISVGLLVSAILVVNNIRDLDTDARVGKRTLAVRLGRQRTRKLYRAYLVIALLALPPTLLIWSGPALSLLGLLVIPLALRLDLIVRSRTDGPALNDALAKTGALVGIFSLLVSLGLLLTS